MEDSEKRFRFSIYFTIETLHLQEPVTKKTQLSFENRTIQYTYTRDRPKKIIDDNKKLSIKQRKNTKCVQKTEKKNKKGVQNYTLC